MTTLGQIKRIVGPMVERHPDLVPIGPWLIVKPVRHVVRGILIDRTGDADRFRRGGRLSISASRCVRFRLIGANCSIDQHSVVEVERPFGDAQTCSKSWRKSRIPVLSPLETLESFATFVNSDRFRSNRLRLFPLRKPRVDAALGNLEAARSSCHTSQPRSRYGMVRHSTKSGSPLRATCARCYLRTTYRELPGFSGNGRPSPRETSRSSRSGSRRRFRWKLSGTRPTAGTPEKHTCQHTRST